MMNKQNIILAGHSTKDKNKCPQCNSFTFGLQTIKRGDPTLTDDYFTLWICRNCNYQPYSNIRGLV